MNKQFSSTIKEKEYLARHRLHRLPQTTLLLMKIIRCFLCLVDILYYLEHSRLRPSESCLLADCQLRNIV